MKRPALTALTSGAAGGPAAAVLSAHGAASTTVIAVTGLALLIGVLAPELFWLLALALAARQRRWEFRHLPDVSSELRERIVARDPVADIVRARATPPGPPAQDRRIEPDVRDKKRRRRR